LYILDDFIELSSIAVFLDEEEAILSRSEVTPSRREGEEERIECELEMIFPLLYCFIAASSLE
jgi:hypothetical protein